jgi:hypothetical protein
MVRRGAAQEENEWNQWTPFEIANGRATLSDSRSIFVDLIKLNLLFKILNVHVGRLASLEKDGQRVHKRPDASAGRAPLP